MLVGPRYVSSLCGASGVMGDTDSQVASLTRLGIRVGHTCLKKDPSNMYTCICINTYILCHMYYVRYLYIYIYLYVYVYGCYSNLARSPDSSCGREPARRVSVVSIESQKYLTLRLQAAQRGSCLYALGLKVGIIHIM